MSFPTKPLIFATPSLMTFNCRLKIDWDNIPDSTMLAPFVEYTHYDGTDAMMARKLMNLGTRHRWHG